MWKAIAARAAFTLLILTAAGPSLAATLELQGSVLSVAISSLAPVTIAQSAASVPVAVSSGSGGFVLPSGVFAGSTAIPTQLFTGVSLISSLNVSAVNKTLSVAAGAAAGGLGGAGATVGVLGGLLNLVIPIGNIGMGGATANAAAALAVTVTGHAWTTGVVSVTGITMTTAGGLFVNTLSLSGYDDRTAGHKGTLQLVTPFRVLTNAAGHLPGVAFQTLKFVPEPGTLLLLLASGAGLAVIGQRRGSR